VLRRTRRPGGCSSRVGVAWLVTDPVLNVRVRPRRGAGAKPDTVVLVAGNPGVGAGGQTGRVLLMA
jgi:hypothetical protein